MLKPTKKENRDKVFSTIEMDAEHFCFQIKTKFHADVEKVLC